MSKEMYSNCMLSPLIMDEWDRWKPQVDAHLAYALNQGGCSEIQYKEPVFVEEYVDDNGELIPAHYHYVATGTLSP